MKNRPANKQHRLFTKKFKEDYDLTEFNHR